jgi:hypothetical protein
MKSPLLEHLRRCNNSLRKHSFENYKEFLRILLGSTMHHEARVLESLLKDEKYTDLVLHADLLASTKYQTADEHLLLNQLSAVIRKYPWPVGSVQFDPRAAATKTFMSSEHKCSHLNKRFLQFMTNRSPHEYELSQARTWIRYVLGELNLSDIWSNCDFGPGASVGIHGNVTNSARKLLAERWSVTPSAFYYGYASVMQDNLIWEGLMARPNSPYYSRCPQELFSAYSAKAAMIDHNKISFVPKTAKTERTIAVEPLLNGYIQKGVDVLMRKKLKRVGIDLNDQSHNQELARKGSLVENDPYVTIDLSAASDSISIGLCEYMLPSDWFDFLNSVRSKYYLMEGRLTRYHKFTTMGNGFCFPLETLLFASLCQVAYQESGLVSDYSVYGDDIIVRQSVAARVLELLKVCGFKANLEKTFLEGPFRESCGADWFEGKDVRPISLDYAFDSVENIFKFCNLLGSKDTWKSIFYCSKEFLLSLVPQKLMFTRPYKGNVDTALEVSLDSFLASPYSRWCRDTQTWSWMEIRKSAQPDNLVKRFTGYNVALMRGALTGSTSPVPFAERRRTRTKVCRISTSSGWSLFVPFGDIDYHSWAHRGTLTLTS